MAYFERNSCSTVFKVNIRKWLITREKLLPTNYLSLFDHFVDLALKGLKIILIPCNQEGCLLRITHLCITSRRRSDQEKYKLFFCICFLELFIVMYIFLSWIKKSILILIRNSDRIRKVWNLNFGTIYHHKTIIDDEGKTLL